MKKRLLPLMILALVAISACQAPALAVGKAYMDALARGDMDGMVSQVADSVILVVNSGGIFDSQLTGKEAMRGYYQQLGPSGFRLELTGDPMVSGNQVTFPDRFAINDFRNMGIDWVTGKDVLTIENGKVVRDVWTIDDASRQALAAALAAQMALTPKKLAGTWRFDLGPEFGNADVRYHEDGTYEMVRYVVDSEILWDQGTYAIEGDTVTLTTTQPHYCKAGDRGVYRIKLTDQGQLESTAVEDACWQRKPPVEGPMLASLYKP